MKMLYRSLIMMLLAFVSLPLLAAETGEAIKPWWAEVQVISNKNPSRALLWYEKDLTERFGFYALAEKESDGYAEFYIGPKVKAFDWLTLGVGVGHEVVPREFSSVRKNVYLNAELGKVSVWGLFENGRSGMWDKVTVTYAASDKFGAGVMHERSFGYGPRVEFNFGDTHKTQLWVAILQGRYPNADDIVQKTTTAIVGINASF